MVWGGRLWGALFNSFAGMFGGDSDVSGWRGGFVGGLVFDFAGGKESGMKGDTKKALIEAVEVPEIKELLSAAGSLLGCATRDCNDFGDEFWGVDDDDYEALDKAFDTIQGIVTGGE